MREIKFRDYEPNKKEMRYFDLDIYDRNEHCSWTEAMQFTGLHDKNGKEIYEGDIVKFETLDAKNNQELIGEIVYSRNSFKVSVPEMNGAHVDFYDPYIEVIGNIHEKPELTK